MATKTTDKRTFIVIALCAFVILLFVAVIVSMSYSHRETVENDMSGSSFFIEGYPDSELTIDQSRFYGNDGCNDFQGDFAVNDTGTITFKTPVATLMACIDAQDSQTAYADLWDQSQSVENTDHGVLLTNVDTHQTTSLIRK